MLVIYPYDTIGSKNYSVNMGTKLDKKELLDTGLKSSVKENEKDKKDASICMALGVGVGALGAASAALSGALCPLCIFIAPGLVGLGAYRRWRASKSTAQ